MIYLTWLRIGQKFNLHHLQEISTGFNMAALTPKLGIGISLNTKFQFELTILIFWTKFAQKGYFQSKTAKMNTTIEFCIFKLVLVPNFSLN